ncbi:putative zinc-binding protein [uncultured Methanobrevibacter sp.]|uniref:putative zinc-binding protein n=1 Tax=uncultured Methanobrevibacter sp. TaxID=253161 RepID=UPI00260929EC|nr:putative zinc-binding protein [uncultured Methanobrevibacter sp.]
MTEKVALASCNGMSPNGLVSRVAVGDCKKENENVISICMGSTSADIEGENNPMLKKYPIISINGCSNNCVNRILENKGINVKQTIEVGEVLKHHNISSKDPFRLDDEGEKCVEIIKNEIIKKIMGI